MTETEVHKTNPSASKKRKDPSAVRKRRIREYLNESLKEPNPLSANLGAEASNLMSLGQQLHEAIEQRMSNSEDLLRDLEKMNPAVETYLKVTRQWDRLIQLSHRMSAGTKNSDSTKN